MIKSAVMKKAWQVAELLEEIAEKADPAAAMRKNLANMIAGVRKSYVTYIISIDPVEKEVSAIYVVPIATAMEGVDGAPEEVIAWLQTGVGAAQHVKLRLDDPTPAFLIVQTIRDEQVFDEVAEQFEKTLNHGMRQRDGGDGG
jgi:hypothetical protein